MQFLMGKMKGVLGQRLTPAFDGLRHTIDQCAFDIKYEDISVGVLHQLALGVRSKNGCTYQRMIRTAAATPAHTAAIAGDSAALAMTT